MNKPMKSSFEAEYSAISRWVKESGNAEMAHPAFRGVGVTSSSISAPSNALPRFRTL